jgi:HSP20 family protein
MMFGDPDDDWLKRWKRLMPYGPWVYSNFFEQWMKQTEEEFREFDELVRSPPTGLLRESRYPDGSVRREVGPIVYGYSVTFGSNGKPVIREFGNLRHGGGPPLRNTVTPNREPLVDVIDGEKELRVTLELPGVRKEDIDLTIDDRMLTLAVDRGERRYRKELELPDSAKTDGAQATFNNGILQVVFPKESRGGSAVRLKVE